MILVYVGLGGAFGAIMRYLVSMSLANSSGNFPMGTFIVNVIGSFCLGAIYTLGINASISAGTQALLATGLLGAFTTFSTFSNETLVLLQKGRYAGAALYMLTSLAAGLLAAAAGHLLTGFFLASRQKQKEESDTDA